MKEAKQHLTALARLVEKSETVVVTRNGKPVLNLVPHRGKPLNFAAGKKFLKQRGVKEIFPFVADDFDAALPEDFLLRSPFGPTH